MNRRRPLHSKFYPLFSVLLLVFLVVAGALGDSLVAATESEPGRGDDWTVIRAQPSPFNPSPSGEQRLRIAGPADLISLDPATAKDLGTMFMVRQIFAGLTRLDANLQAVPALADEISISPDGLTYRFRLSDRAQFQDGRQIQAGDVAFSFTRALNPATTGGDISLLAAPTFLADIAGARELLDGTTVELSGVAVVDDQTIDITLSEPRSTFLMRLATAPASIIDPEDMALGEQWWEMPNGSGGFEVESIDLASQLVLRSNPNYYLGEPPLEEIVVALGTASFQPMNLYEQGDIDLSPVTYFGLDRALDPASDLHADLRVTDLFAVEYVAFRTDVEPFSDPSIRKALILGFPREKVAHVTFNDTLAAADGFIPNGLLGEPAWPIEGWDYDLEAARQAIIESSYGSPENVPPIVIYSNGPPGRLLSFKAVIERDLGLAVEVISVEWHEYSSTLTEKRYPAYGFYWGVDYPDPESLLLTLFGSGQADNHVDYSNPEFDRLLESAASEQDVVKRTGLYQQANQVLMDDAVVLPFYYDRAHMLVRPYVKGLAITNLGILYFDQTWIER